jgi:hypothetical protein
LDGRVLASWSSCFVTLGKAFVRDDTEVAHAPPEKKMDRDFVYIDTSDPFFKSNKNYIYKF